MKDNDILLRLADLLEEREIVRSTEFIYPAEYLPPAFLLSGKSRAIAQLGDTFSAGKRTISVARYWRLPGLEFSYRLLERNGITSISRRHHGNDYDLIHAHTILPDGLVAARLADRWSIPYALTVRSGDIEKMKELGPRSHLLGVYHDVLGRAKKVMAHNFAAAEFVRETRDDIEMIPHWFDGPAFSGDKPVSGPLEFITAGRMIPGKNYDWILEAFSDIDPSRYKLTVVGGGPLLASLRDLALRLGVNVEFTGELSRPSVLGRLDQAHVFVLPSDRETFGMAYLEAAAMGCLVVGRKGVGVYGWLREPRDATFVDDRAELHRCLRELCTQVFDLKAARERSERVLREFSRQAVGDRYRRFYE